MNKYVFIFVFFILLIRWSYFNLSRSRSNHYLISFFILMILFDFGTPLYTYLSNNSFNSFQIERLGAFGNSYRFSFFVLIIPIGLILGYSKFVKFNLKNYKWEIISLIFVVISFLNPFNPFPKSLFVFLFFIIQILFSIFYIKANFSNIEVFRGIFDSFSIITFIQTLLVILYPILNQEWAVNIFKGDILEYALKREGYASAVGIFGHPGTLAVICLIISIFFLSCYLNNYRKHLSFILLILNIFIIIFTLSRTTYVVCCFILIIVYITFKSEGRLFSLKNLMKIFFFFFFFILFLFLSPLNSLFLASDFENQIAVRFSSWFLGSEILKISPIFGVGINSHVYFAANFLKIQWDLAAVEFLLTNPIHNIHMIIASEIGILGLFFWLFYFYKKITGISNVIYQYNYAGIFNLTFMCILISIFIYGFFGWAPFRREVICLALLFSHYVKFFSSEKKLICSVTSIKDNNLV